MSGYAGNPLTPYWLGNPPTMAFPVTPLSQINNELSAANPPSGQFNTPLTPEQEQQFQAWLQQRSAAAGRDLSNDLHDYDLRGAWLSGAATASNGHLPDTFKKPNHPTFSDQSQYSSLDRPGGAWSQALGGSWAFTPSSHNLRQFSPEALQQYWQRAEPGNRLILPQQGDQ